MAKRLVIAEKPSVARDIAAALGGFVDHAEYLESDAWVVTWALGHLLELAEPEDYDKALRSWSIRLLPIIPEAFRIKPREGHKKRLDLIRKLGTREDVDGVVNACDAGREGELIFRRIAEHTGLDGVPTERLWLQSMTVGAIREAFKHLVPGAKMNRLGDAAWLRAVGDWLVGMNATRALTQRLKSRGETESWSAGRVQTPTLALMVRREREIQAHVPREYWEIVASFHAPGPGSSGPVPHDWEGRYWDPGARSRGTAAGEESDLRPSRLFDRAKVDAILAGLARARQVHAGERRKKSRQSPPLLFDLTALQREANRRFSLSAKRTLDAAQRLYEAHKLLTYPRTDARYLPSDYAPTVATILDALSTQTGALAAAAELAELARGVIREGPQNLERLLDGTKVTDHFAIVPTGVAPSGMLSGDDARIYELVFRQFLAALMGPATWSTVERTVEIPYGERDPARFRTTAKTLEIPGFLAALGQSADDSVPLPPLAPGSDEAFHVPVALLQWTDERKETRPPARLTEAQLLRMMETAGEQVDQEELSEAMRGRGLGTPATRAETIEKLVTTQYIRRVEGKLVPTSKAMRLLDVLERADAGALPSPKLTGEWQFSLDQVERGEKRRDEVQVGLADYTRAIVASLVGFEHEKLYAGDPALGICPQCGAEVVEVVWGYRCRNNTGADAECNFMIWKDRAGRYVDRELVKRLLAERKVTGVDGFVDRAGRRFLTGSLQLERDPEKGRWILATEFGAAGPEGVEIPGDPIAPCPCGNPGCEVIETNQRFVCRRVLTGVDRHGPVLPKVVCGREMAIEEAQGFFGAEGKTALLENFISRRNRPFKGFVVRRESGRHGFEFPERPGRGPAAGADEAAAPPKKSTRGKKAAAEKPATRAKKATADKPDGNAAAEKPATRAKKATAGRPAKKATAEKPATRAKKATAATPTQKAAAEKPAARAKKAEPEKPAKPARKGAASTAEATPAKASASKTVTAKPAKKAKKKVVAKARKQTRAADEGA